MEEFRRLADCLKSLDLNHPERIDLPRGSDTHEAILRKVNELITDYKKQQVDMAILSQSFNEVQANLLESQKMAKVGSFVYDVKKDSFSATTQIYRILGRKLGNKLKWKKFVECVDSEDRDDFLQKVESALCKGSKFYYRFGLSSSSGKTIDVEGRFKVRKKSSGSVKLIGTIMDISKQIEIEKTIEFLAFHDPLTGLGNRRLFNSRLTEAVTVAKRYDDLVGVLFIDVDRFKYINDTLGHNVGDRLIKEIAQILRKIVRESDTVARLGGDEFVILLPRLESIKSVEAVAKKIIKELKKSFLVDSHQLYTTVSIGISIFPNHTTNADELVTFADAAMYRAKELGRNNYQMYELTMTKDFSDQLSLEQDLRRAIEKEDEIVLFYQPKVNLKNGKIVGAEALVRWKHPHHGLLYPDKFIDLAENTGIIIPIGQKVLELAAIEIKSWESQGLSVAVNLSGRQFQHGSLVENVKHIIEKYGIDPSKLELEITETISMSNVKDSIRILKDLKDLGVTLSIDDFGTGYSSLSYLKKLPVDVLKIDREFVMDMHKDKGDVMISKAIIGMGKSLDFKIVAEGVELQEHIEILNSMDCEFGQGFFYSKAVAKEEFEKLLQMQE